MRSGHFRLAVWLLCAGVSPLAGQRIGTAGIQVGMVQGISQLAGTDAGARAHFAFAAGRFSFGPEAAVAYFDPSHRALELGAVARYRFGSAEGSTGPEPYVVAGLGYSRWETRYQYGAGYNEWFATDLIGGSVGAGFRFPLNRSLAWSAETRLHSDLQHDGLPGGRRFLSVLLGLQADW